MWYKNCYRRHLCDMHIADWDDRFLSEFSPEEYVANLERAKIKSAMIYFQSHVGLCYYPTESGQMHRALIGKEDMVRRVVELCHEKGIAVTGYYSLLYNTVEHDRHPEWRLLRQNGISHRASKTDGNGENFRGSRYGLCCPNNPEYRDFCRAQIKEMAEFFPKIEGMFYDMLFWPAICHCDHCKARWEREVGGEMPTEEDWSDPRWLLHMRKRREWIGEYAQWIRDISREYFGDISVVHNVAYSALSDPKTANAEEVISACDYAGGDIYVDMYTHSFACKFYRGITKNQPFEYMLSRCAPGLGAHTQLKSEDILRCSVFLTAAHHGATLVIDAIDPVGTIDSRVYDRIGKIFGELEPYEKYMVGEPVEDVGIYYSLRSKFKQNNEKYSNYNGCSNTVKSCVIRNILSGVTGGYRALDSHKVLILPFLTSEDDYDVERITEYVENGGRVYFSGAYNQKLLRAFFGAKKVGQTKERAVYIAPEERAATAFGHFNKKYPLSYSRSAPIVEGIKDECVIAKITLPYTDQDGVDFASIHSNPPGVPSDIPAMAVTNYGKGKVLWSALPIEACEIYDYADVLEALLAEFLDFKPTITSDAPADVELTLFKDGDRYLLSSALLSDQYKARKVEDLSVKLTLDISPTSVTKLPSGEPVSFKADQNTVEFKITQPGIFSMMEIK